MAKVYRLHDGIDGKGWFDSNPISSQELDSIKIDGKEIATSIPSPFARIDLVKSAFRWVAENGIYDESNSDTAHHRLVSDALDVAQLFFILPKHRDKVKVIAWDPNVRLQNMISQDGKKKDFAETLKVFWDQDSQVYNFDKIQRLYFILNNSNEIIGGTSSATLFMPAPDVMERAKGLNITCGQDVLFDDDFCQIWERDTSFIEYMYSFLKTDNFASLFPEVYQYLEASKNMLEDSLRTRVSNFDSSTINKYNKCPVLGNSMDTCEVLGIPMGLQPDNINSISQDSDFLIVPELNVNNQKPLILPNDWFSDRWVYTVKGILWDKNYKIPSKNDNSPEQSILPIQGDKYYWLSIDNFLQDSIIKLPYKIRSLKFITCGLDEFLLPLTNTFFKYFQAENAAKYLTLASLPAGGVEARLKIPVKGGEIEYKKLYNLNTIVKLNANLSILPFVKSKSIDLDYIIGLYDDPFQQGNIEVETYLLSSKNKIEKSVIRRDGDGRATSSRYLSTKKFDAIQISYNKSNGFIVPNMPKSGETEYLSFAIDFGTTNTHIEYKLGDNPPQTIENTNDNPIWQSLIDRSIDGQDRLIEDSMFDLEIMPYEYSNQGEYSFPFRTALLHNEDVDFNEKVISHLHTNNFYLHEKRSTPTKQKAVFNLKWSNYKQIQDKICVESYIENLLNLVLYKTLLLNGNPSKTIIKWFYPVSMDSFEKGIFQNTWETMYQKVFNVDDLKNLICIPESVPPFLEYRNSYPGLSLSIDVGGGSSDIALFKNANNIPEFISSFKFAGNSIFGDGLESSFAGNIHNNGFVSRYKDSITNALSSNSAGNNEKNKILKDILDKNKNSAEFSSFLFSLEEDSKLNFNYTNLLQSDKQLKLTIFVFWAAVAYYASKLMNKYGVNDLPKNLLLSGTASKTVNVFGANSAGTSKLSDLFLYVLKSNIIGDRNSLNVALSDNPKALTCKGALKIDGNIDVSNCPIVFWLGGSTNLMGNIIRKNGSENLAPKFEVIETVSFKNEIKESVLEFFRILDGYVNKINLTGEYGIDHNAYNTFKRIREDHIIDFIEQGVKGDHKRPNDIIEDTLFFYPLIGILNKYSYEVTKNTDSDD